MNELPPGVDFSHAGEPIEWPPVDAFSRRRFGDLAEAVAEAYDGDLAAAMAADDEAVQRQLDAFEEHSSL